jgi:hypothetical protein
MRCRSRCATVSQEALKTAVAALHSKRPEDNGIAELGSTLPDTPDSIAHAIWAAVKEAERQQGG